MTDNIILKRHSLIQHIDYYINESVYYRTHSDQFNNEKQNLFELKEEFGKVTVK